MKTPTKLLTLGAGILTLICTACSSNREYEVRNAPPNHFYCVNCDEYHTFQHSHYRFYHNNRDYEAYPQAKPTRAHVYIQPGRSTPLGVPEAPMAQPASRVD
ncbi:MAG TPA: hypothetical protein VGH19_03920 [Verrucomicrobiae bacterium]